MKKQKSRQSTANSEQKESERDKLIRLVQVWRTKYEKVYSTSRGFDGIIKGLKRENEQLRNEKETVSKDLQDKLQTQRAEAEVKISKLLTIADTAAKQNEVETRDIKTKLRRLEVDTQPIIDMYKERDEKMQNKVEQLENENVALRSEIEEMVGKLQDFEIQRSEEIAEIKKKHRQIILRMKMQSTANLARKLEIGRAEVRREIEDKVEKEKSLTPLKKETEEQDRDENEIILKLRQQIELMKKQKQDEVMELQAKITAVILEKNKVVEEYSAELLKLRKKSELGRLNTKQREETIKYLKNAITNANTQLSTDRTRRKVLQKTSLPVKELSRQLVVTIRETRSIERALKRLDILKTHNGFFEVDDVLRLEVLYSSKISEVTRLKRLIHEQLVEEIYSPRSPHARRNPTNSTRARSVSLNGDPISDNDEIVFLRNGYGSDSDSQSYFVSKKSHSGDELSDTEREAKRQRRKKIVQRPVHVTGRTSWLLAPKHYSDINII